MQQIKSLLFSASDLICKVHSPHLRHQEYRLDADGHGGAADGSSVASQVFVVRIAGGHCVTGRARSVPDGLRLDARGVLEAAGPDDG